MIGVLGITVVDVLPLSEHEAPGGF